MNKSCTKIQKGTVYHLFLIFPFFVAKEQAPTAAQTNPHTPDPRRQQLLPRPWSPAAPAHRLRSAATTAAPLARFHAPQQGQRPDGYKDGDMVRARPSDGGRALSVFPHAPNSGCDAGGQRGHTQAVAKRPLGGGSPAHSGAGGPTRPGGDRPERLGGGGPARPNDNRPARPGGGGHACPGGGGHARPGGGRRARAQEAVGAHAPTRHPCGGSGG
ncbi:hypothetical protein GUJ93_ZPchr0010g10179 [Zizania palustris]|uniref:Uncharacterized protein n=1 Tax=Zizania palustris TaxID=103762 RepID=A0A8J5WAN6_ZIZPA|nr:hypothetical protein GUJ93_ZPchr0010g10179 [Zizania palustris]